MILNRRRVLISMLAAAALQLAAVALPAQTPVLINAFDSATEVTANNGAPWGNWFGTAYYQVVWDQSDASNNPASGSMQVQAFFPDSGISGCCGPQFLVYNQNNGINPPLVGNGGNPSAAIATNVEFDIRFDPSSFAVTNATSTNWPTMEVGTRGIDFNQHDFGTVTIPASQTNWVHEIIPIAPNAVWTNIPNVFFKYFSSTANGFLIFYIDNIKFTTATVPIVPPHMTIQKAQPSMRVFAGTGSQYDRAQLATADTNQSWVGGSYPVSYSYTLSDYSQNPSLNQVHLTLVPLNYDTGGVINQFTDYSTASNSVWLQVVGPNTGSTVTANVAWKTNGVNNNPTNIVLNITNSTAVGTWTLTFNSATDGTLTAPGASPVPFSLPADVAATFGNPLVVFFGAQPNNPPAIGQHVDYTKIQTTGVAAPGVPINYDFTTGASLDTNVWNTGAGAAATDLVIVNSNAAWWVSWSFPDYGGVPGTKADLTSAVPWKTPLFYTGYNSNSVYQGRMGTNSWLLVPKTGVPTIDGSSNGVASSRAFFRMQSPPPTQ